MTSRGSLCKHAQLVIFILQLTGLHCTSWKKQDGCYQQQDPQAGSRELGYNVEDAGYNAMVPTHLQAGADIKSEHQVGFVMHKKHG